MADGDDVLTKVKVAEALGASAAPVLLVHLMELPLILLLQPSEFAAPVGSEDRLSALVVQPY